MSRSGRPRPGRTTMSAAAREILTGDYPQVVKMRVALAARGVMAGKRTCLVCGAPGLNTRVYVPPEALRVDQPVYTEIQASWVCGECAELDGTAPEIVQKLRARRARR